MAADPDLECHRVALEQNGVIARRQALALGLSPDSIYRRIQAGRWERLLPSVYRVAGFPDSWLQRLTAAALWVGDGGVVCGRAAGALWGLDGCPEGSIELLTTVKRSGVPASMSLRYSAHLAGRDTTAHKGLRVTTVTRTLLDLGSALASDRLEIVLEDALRKRMTAIPQLKDLVDGRCKGVAGATRLRALLQRREPSQRPTDSSFEVKLFALLRAAKLPLPVPGYTVTDRGRFIARADLAYPERRLIIEAHSYRWHSGRKEWDRDIQRDKDLRRLGWRIIYVTYEDLTQRPEQVIADVRHGLGQGDLFA